MSTTINPNKALWEKGDFTRIAESMRESGEALVDDVWESPTGSRSSTSAAATEPRPCRRRGSARTCSASTSPATSSRRGTHEHKSLGLTNCTIPRRRRVRSERARGRQLRPRHQHLRRDVRSEAVRRGKGARSCDTARRPDRHGQLDPQRPDARRTDPEDQLLLLAATSGRVRQSDDVGRRGQRDRAIRGAGVPEEKISFERDTYTFNFPGTPSELRWLCSGRTTDRR